MALDTWDTPPPRASCENTLSEDAPAHASVENTPSEFAEELRPPQGPSAGSHDVAAKRTTLKNVALLRRDASLILQRAHPRAALPWVLYADGGNREPGSRKPSGGSDKGTGSSKPSRLRQLAVGMERGAAILLLVCVDARAWPAVALRLYHVQGQAQILLQEDVLVSAHVQALQETTLGAPGSGMQHVSTLPLGHQRTCRPAADPVERCCTPFTCANKLLVATSSSVSTLWLCLRTLKHETGLGNGSQQGHGDGRRDGRLIQLPVATHDRRIWALGNDPPVPHPPSQRLSLEF